MIEGSSPSCSSACITQAWTSGLLASGREIRRSSSPLAANLRMAGPAQQRLPQPTPMPTARPYGHGITVTRPGRRHRSPLSRLALRNTVCDTPRLRTARRTASRAEIRLRWCLRAERQRFPLQQRSTPPAAHAPRLVSRCRRRRL
jgi:hypothetical protein